MKSVYVFLKPRTFAVLVKIIKDNKILLIKNSYRKGWTVPGGYLNKYEPFEEAAKREVCEETGYKVNSLEFFGIYYNFKKTKSDTVLVYLCKEFSEGNCCNSEVTEQKWFDINDLPKDLYPGTERRILEFIEGSYPNHGKW